MRTIDADELKEQFSWSEICRLSIKEIKQIIDNAPTIKDRNQYKKGYCDCLRLVIEMFNKYDILLCHIDGKISPVKNTTKQDCYNLLYEIQEFIK